MQIELDHLFVCTALGAPEAEKLVQFGLHEGPPFVNSAITRIKSVMRSAFPPASSRTSFVTPMPQRCFMPVLVFSP